MRITLYLAFWISGFAALLYELTWTRYLALFVGHSAYAQVVVISVFLGGMAVGALAVGERSRRLKRPLRTYALAEAALAVGGVAFHAAFQWATSGAYDVLLPSLTGATASAARWALAVGLILPQSVLLGTTFPLLSSGLLRVRAERAGRTLADLYFLNSLGGAVGVLVGGFVLVAAFGLPGTLAVAAAGNLLAAVLAAGVSAKVEPTRAPTPDPEAGAAEAHPRRLVQALLAVSFFTAVASFTYEIAWIRMLSLVMGSATHSFELMLSAFILGLALGSLLVRRLADRAESPVRVLAVVQWVMGLTALATLPAYVASFEWMATLLSALPADEAGYRLFSVGRYGLAMAVMLPSTVCAGMTLPLITATLLRSGVGERAIGWVYGVNTLGSVAGVYLAALVLLPALGLKSMIVAGAVLDMALGVLLLRFVAARGRRLWAPLAVGALGVAALTLVGVDFSRSLLTSGVYRSRRVVSEDDVEMLYYRDGRTASVGVHRHLDQDRVTLTTNGKPDASLSLRWLQSVTRPLPPAAIREQDESTQLMLGVLGHVHVPDARSAAQIGHGSGVTGHILLAGGALEELVTVEIEPAVLEASRAFLPANRLALEDPRSRFVVDDARAFFAHGRRTYDVVVSEPSNPWVSGVASLFTKEFYRSVVDYVGPGGVFVQWVQLYELRDDDVLGILAALDGAFPSYRAYVVAAGDMVLVASPDELPEPDWSVLGRLDEQLAHVHPFTEGHLRSMQVFDADVVRPLVANWPEANSDFMPYLDLRAERSRFLDTAALGVTGLTRDRFDLVSALSGRREPLAHGYEPVPVWGLASMRRWGLSGWVRAGGPDTGGAPEPAYARALAGVRSLREGMARGLRPPAWRGWARGFSASEAHLHWGSAGVADEAFYEAVFDYLDGAEAPPEVRAVADFHYGLRTWDFERAAAAAPLLVELVAVGREWIDPALLHDGAVVALMRVGEPERALAVARSIGPLTGRGEGDFRARLLRAHVRAALGEGGPERSPSSR